MIDFQLNKNGDLLFEESQVLNNSFELNFFVSKSDTLTINFYTENLSSFSYLENHKEDRILNPGICLNLYIKKIENNKEVVIAKDEDYIEQQIKIRLQTALGTLLNNEGIGSDLDLYKHNIIADNDNFSVIRESAKRAISDILPNAEIDVQKIETIYLDYSNSLMITIKNDDYNYYYYV